MKTIGVLGGFSAAATMDFERRVHHAALRHLPRKLNTGFPPMVVYYHRRPPFVLDGNGVPLQPLAADPDLLAAAGRIGPLADFVVVSANAPHLFRDEFERASGKPVLSMVQLTVDDVRRRGWKRVGVLGFGIPTVYLGPLDSLGLQTEILDAEPRAALDRAIVQVMEGTEDAASHRVAAECVGVLRERGVDGVVLGCTEIPLLLDKDAPADDLVNPIALLAEAAVLRSMA